MGAAVKRFAGAFNSCGIFLQNNRTNIIACAGSTILAVCGLMPRAGLETLPWGLTHFFSGVETVSQRIDVVDSIRESLLTSNKDQYIVVSGEKGVGKTCAVETSLLGSFDVVYVSVPPATPHEKILSNVYNAITRGSSMLDNSASARRVLWCHQFFYRQTNDGGASGM